MRTARMWDFVSYLYIKPPAKSRSLWNTRTAIGFKSCFASKTNSRFFNSIAYYATILRLASPTLAAYDIRGRLFLSLETNISCCVPAHFSQICVTASSHCRTLVVALSSYARVPEQASQLQQPTSGQPDRRAALSGQQYE
jgi:hypothetical protein